MKRRYGYRKKPHTRCGSFCSRKRRQRLGFEVVGTGHAGAADPVVLDVLPPTHRGTAPAKTRRKHSRSRPLDDAANA